VLLLISECCGLLSQLQTWVVLLVWLAKHSATRLRLAADLQGHCLAGKVIHCTLMP
jgi:hypothetical protein